MESKETKRNKSKAGKIIRNIVIIILCLVLVGCVAGSFVVGKMVRDGVFYQNKDNDTKGNSIKQMEKWGYDADAFFSKNQGYDFEVEAEDGVVVPGTYYLTGNDEGKYVIIAHGAGGDRNAVLPVADIFLKNGYNVISYDQRGSGDNSSDKVSFGIWEKRDVKALVDYARNELKADELVVLGQSMGGMTVALYAATDHAYENVDSIILDSPVPGMKYMLLNMFTEDGTSLEEAEYILWCGEVYCKLFDDFDFNEGNTIDIMKENKCRTLVILSEQDNICLPEDVEALYSNIASSDKKLVRLDSKHIEGSVDYPNEYEEYVMDFLK